MKVLQINLHHSKAASAALLLRLASGEVDIVLVQEPWITGDRICGLRTRDFTLFFSRGKGKPRTCILVKNKFNSFILPQFSGGDLTVVGLALGNRIFRLASFYFGHDDEGPLPPAYFQDLVRNTQPTTILIMGGDANAHHTQWGSTDINDRGESILNYLINTNLNICNRGNNPTFITKNRREVLDITLVSDTFSDQICAWRVSNEHSFSDHRYIEFCWQDTNPTVPSKIKNLRRTNWGYYTRLITKQLALKHLYTPENEAQLDNLVDYFTKQCSDALQKACPNRTYKKPRKPPWWTRELEALRRECRKEFNAAKRSNSESSWNCYKSRLSTYKMALRKAKRTSWANFCSEIESTTEGARLRRILSKFPVSPSCLQDENGGWTDSSSGTLNLLMDTHFPGSCSSVSRTATNSTSFPAQLIKSVVSRKKVKWAVSTFEPFKSPGPDGIIPAQLQRTLPQVLPWLQEIFAGCLRMNHVPTCWKEVRVVFIPKAGKASHVSPSDFRPISLSSFLLKTLERLIDFYMRQTIDPVKISNAQHAYIRGRSTDSALHSLVSTIEESLEAKEYTLSAFLDIAGAFNNVLPCAVTQALMDLGVEPALVMFVCQLLTNRAVSSELGGSSVRRFVNRGTPQGGVLSPFLWVVTLNQLLHRMERGGFRVIAYADDVVVITKGKFPQTLCDLMETALATLSSWAVECGLSVNPTKTELVLFTRKYKIPNLRPPKLNNVRLEISDRAKYLGVILDKKLLWNYNLEERIKKAYTALFACKKTIGKKWGFSPSIVRWIYTAVVRPILLYGILVWWPTVCKSSALIKLNKVQRSAELCITGALRTTPTEALNTMLHLPPLDLMAREGATIAALRLRESGLIKSSGGHARVLNSATIPTTTDFCVTNINFTQLYDVYIPTRRDWESRPHFIEGAVNIYTDGSKLDGRIGGGVFFPEQGIETFFRLPNHCSVYQAEILAIQEAVNCLPQTCAGDSEVFIFTDSQAALKALRSFTDNCKTISECRKSLNEMAQQFRIHLIWVPGHRDIEGNEKADELARRGTTAAILPGKDRVGIPWATFKLQCKQDTINRAKERWRTLSSCTTARKTWPSYNLKRTTSLLSFRRTDLSNLVGVLTGHCLIGQHALRLGREANDCCRSCKCPDEEESVEHFLCHCLALSRRRLASFGQPTLLSLNELSEIGIKEIGRFIVSSKWFSGEMTLQQRL